MSRIILGACCLLAMASCASLSPPSGPILGGWGGQHVGLMLTPDGGRLDYDCADGQIEGPVVAGPGGQFEASGWHRPGHGGPAREGEVLPRWPARYAGTVSGEWMTLRVDVLDRGIVIGPYRLRRGAEPILMRCL